MVKAFRWSHGSSKERKTRTTSCRIVPNRRVMPKRGPDIKGNSEAQRRESKEAWDWLGKHLRPVGVKNPSANGDRTLRSRVLSSFADCDLPPRGPSPSNKRVDEEHDHSAENREKPAVPG